MLGEQINEWPIDAYLQHHDVLEKPDGNFIVAVTNHSADTGLDFMIEMDRNSGEVIKEWDFREVLDVDRFDLFFHSYDWLHVNSIFYDEADGGIIVSGRSQGIFKVSENNELLWILAPHQGWELAGRNGDGLDTRDYLLTAVNEIGQPFPEEIQQGSVDQNNFSWPWSQHAAMILPNGHIFCFDNGFKRNFMFDLDYSRAVEYKIDLDRKEVRQVWQYGKERGVALQSINISDVDYLPITKNRMMISGNIFFEGQRSGRMIEIAEGTQTVVFEAHIKFKDQFSLGNSWQQQDIIYRGERLTLYPN